MMLIFWDLWSVPVNSGLLSWGTAVYEWLQSAEVIRCYKNSIMCYGGCIYIDIFHFIVTNHNNWQVTRQQHNFGVQYLEWWHFDRHCRHLGLNKSPLCHLCYHSSTKIKWSTPTICCVFFRAQTSARTLKSQARHFTFHGQYQTINHSGYDKFMDTGDTLPYCKCI